MKRKIPKPFSELTRAEKIAEAQGAIARLERQLTGTNRFGAYGQSIREAIRRWQSALAELGVSDE